MTWQLLILGGSLAINPVCLHSQEAPQVPPVMYELMGSLYRLQPFMFSAKGFADKANEKTIKESLLALQQASRRLPHSSRLSSTSFQVSAIALQQHLDELTMAFASGRKDYAQRMLIATIDGCSSCHAQVPGRRLPSWTFRHDELKGTEFEKAEFLFAVRHYEEALRHYQNFLRTSVHPTNSLPEQETALRRQLVIYVRILKDIPGALKVFEAHAKNPSLAASLRRDVEGWIVGLKALQKSPPPDALTASLSDVERFASKTIAPLMQRQQARFEPASTVAFLAASGLIFDAINNRQPKDVSPKLLHMLAQCDAQISQGYFFSLTDNYLRECITRYPRSPEAKMCYQDLETSLTEAYSGSAGTDLPPEVSAELKRLRDILSKK